jgi:hypothetical protein
MRAGDGNRFGVQADKKMSTSVESVCVKGVVYLSTCKSSCTEKVEEAK